MKKKRLFHAHMLPEDGIPCRTADILECVVRRKKLVAAGSTVHARFLAPGQPNQGHSHQRSLLRMHGFLPVDRERRKEAQTFLAIPQSHMQLHSDQDGSSHLEADCPQL